MGWLRLSDGKKPLYRVPVTLPGTGGSADWDISLPATFGHFWDQIDASGYELRITDADGVTILAHQLSSFNRTNRTGSVQLDAYTTGSSAVNVVWLYYGISGASNAGSVLTITSAQTGYIDEAAALGPILVPDLEVAGANAPRAKVQKTSTDEAWIYLDFSGLLTPRAVPSDSLPPVWEELKQISYGIYSGASAQAGMVDATKTRVLGRNVVRFLAKAGTSGTDYTLRVTWISAFPSGQTGQTRQGRVLLKVKDLTE